MKMDKYWRDTDRANWVADDSLVEQKESIQISDCSSAFFFPPDIQLSRLVLPFILTLLLEQDVCGGGGVYNL